jgi:hypothetical protein
MVVVMVFVSGFRFQVSGFFLQVFGVKKKRTASTTAVNPVRSVSFISGFRFPLERDVILGHVWLGCGRWLRSRGGCLALLPEVLPVAQDGELDACFTVFLRLTLLDESVIPVSVRLVKEDEVHEDGWLAGLAGDPLEALLVEEGDVDVDGDGHGG